jgi:hypothetical protein
MWSSSIELPTLADSWADAAVRTLYRMVVPHDTPRGRTATIDGVVVSKMPDQSAGLVDAYARAQSILTDPQP